MKKDFLVGLGISDEAITQILDAVKAELQTYIPKDRFDAVNTAKKELETKIGELQDFAGSVEGLKAEIQNLKDQSKQREIEFAKQLEQAKMDSMIESALHGAKAKSIKAVRAYLDTKKISVDGEKLKGLDEQLAALKAGEETAFLFNSEKPSTGVSGTTPTNGGSGGAAGQKPTNLNEALKNHYETQLLNRQ